MKKEYIKKRKNQHLKLEERIKIEDDQTPEVPVIFAKWKKQEGIAW